MRFSLSLAAIALAAVASPAVAQSAPTATVETGDLDLNAAENRERLDIRMNSAIRKMCHSGSRDTVARRMENQCRETALANAERQADFAIAAAKRDKAIRIAATANATAG